MIATVWSLIVAHQFLAALVYVACGAGIYLMFLRIDDELAQPPHNQPRQCVGPYGVDVAMAVFWWLILLALALHAVWKMFRVVLSAIATFCEGILHAPALLANRRLLRHASRIPRRPSA